MFCIFFLDNARETRESVQNEVTDSEDDSDEEKT